MACGSSGSGVGSPFFTLVPLAFQLCMPKERYTDIEDCIEDCNE